MVTRNISKELTYTAVVKKLQEAGLRPTKQRIAVANLLFKDGYKHMTAEELHREAYNKGASVSLATIYNTLKQLKEVGLVREINVDSSKCYYDSNTTEHHHYYYEDTGRLEDVKEGDITINKKSNLNKKIKSIDIIVRISG